MHAFLVSYLNVHVKPEKLMPTGEICYKHLICNYVVKFYQTIFSEHLLEWHSAASNLGRHQINFGPLVINSFS